MTGHIWLGGSGGMTPHGTGLEVHLPRLHILEGSHVLLDGTKARRALARLGFREFTYENQRGRPGG